MNALKKLAISLGITFGILLVLPNSSHAQYYYPGYNGGTYINDMIRSRMNARRAAARRAESRSSASAKAKKAKSKKLHYRKTKKRN